MANHEPGHLNWADPTLLTIVGAWLLGALARVLISDERFDPRKFAGELILAGIGGVICYLTGVLHGAPPMQITLFGVLTSLGGVRLLEWIITIARKLKQL